MSTNENQSEVNTIESIPEETSINKPKRKKWIFILFVIGFFIISIFVVHSKWNIIIGYQNCRLGYYDTAVICYEKEINKSKVNQTIKKRYEALSAYLSAEDAYKNDDISEMSKYVGILKSNNSSFPTQRERNELQEKYSQRANEVNLYDKSIREISSLFSDASNIEAIQTKCDELLKKNITSAQKNKLNEIKANADNYIDIKNSYDKSEYEEVIKKVSALKDTYRNYATKESIDNMKKEAQKILDERKLINTNMKSIRDSFNGGKFETALSIAADLLKMNLTEEERKEVEGIKSTCENRIKSVSEQKTTAKNKKSYPEPDEYVIKGASTNVKGMTEVKKAVKQAAKENEVYLRYIETEIDGSLYMEISCERDKDLTKTLSNRIAQAIKGCGYNNLLEIVYTDIAKNENEANRVISTVDIEANGNIITY